MNTNEILIIVSLAVIAGLSMAPFYRNCQLWWLKKLGYWYAVGPILIAVFANVVGCIWSGPIVLFMMIPLDVILLIDAIYTYFKVRFYKKSRRPA
ncbi:hypothetical protein [Lactobacillus sp.]|uniref:hypothetical protein n=1 Tax=Lactobacillus sp. TaxID=1591 RepID=UPI003EF741E9